MKKLILFFCLFILQIIYCQEKEEIYVYFDHGKGQERFFQSTKDGLDKESPNYFIFYDSQFSYLMFGMGKHLNPEIRIEKKSFLKNKNVIKASKLLEMGLLPAAQFFNSQKVFIIDTEKFEKNKIVLREVRAGSSLSYEM